MYDSTMTDVQVSATALILWSIHQQLNKMDEIPSIMIYDTIDLGLLQIAASQSAEHDHLNSSTPLLRYPPSAMIDDFEPDNIYIQHAYGVHAISTSPWRSALYAASVGKGDGEVQDGLVTFWGNMPESQVTSLIEVEAYPAE